LRCCNHCHHCVAHFDLSVTYAIWSGVGTALATMIGIAYFREPITVFRMASIALVTISVIGRSLAARQSN